MKSIDRNIDNTKSTAVLRIINNIEITSSYILFFLDPSALKPDDWDVDMDGEWEAPLVDNPVCEKISGCGKWKAPLIANKEYKGKWRAPMIDNPNYRGKWSARKIPNPDFFEDLTPFKMTPIVSLKAPSVQINKNHF